MSGKGFTMLELIISTALMLIVMAAVMNVLATISRKHMEGVRKSQIQGQANYALKMLNKDLENSSYLRFPNQGTPNDTRVAGCVNFSDLATAAAGGATLDAAGANAKSYYFYYCVDANRFGTLWRYSNGVPGSNPNSLGCGGSCGCLLGPAGSFPVPGACGALTDNATPAANRMAVIAGNGTTAGVSRADGPVAPELAYYFRWAQDNNGVEAHFIVGNSTSSSGGGVSAPPTPQFSKVNTKINMTRSFNNTVD